MGIVTTEEIQKKREKEKKVSGLMIRVYCRGNKHNENRKTLCEDCQALLEYAAMRTEKCPFMETKTFCSNCKVHCYQPKMREQMKAVMRYAGPRMICYHPIMAIDHVRKTIKNRHQREDKK